MKEDQNWVDNRQEQECELEALQSIFPENVQIFDEIEDDDEEYPRRILVEVELPLLAEITDISVSIVSSQEAAGGNEEAEGGNKDAVATGNHDAAAGTHAVRHLPPLLLDVRFPRGYPSDVAPAIRLSSSWMDRCKLTRLCVELDAMWRAEEPVVFSWVDWLENNALRFLDLQQIELCDNVDAKDCDGRTVVTTTTAADALLSILRYDFEKEGAVFMRTNHVCDVCFEEKSGRQFYRLECRHAFCRECMTDYCTLHIQEGTVLQMKCLNTDCEVALSSWLIHVAVGDELFNRYDSLALQRSLDTMQDVEWCPRCSQPVIRDDDPSLNLAVCSLCQYAFCTACYESWHQGVACSSLETQNVARMRWLAASGGQQEKLKRFLDFHVSKQLIGKIAKPCPKCKAPIEKSYGCNKVVCSVCSTTMCYVCGRAILGYEHFGAHCSLFDACWDEVAMVPQQPQEAIMIQIQLNEYPDAWRRLVTCMRCKQRCLRADDRNNHLRCWSCKVNQCLDCKTVIIGPLERISDHRVRASSTADVRLPSKHRLLLRARSAQEMLQCWRCFVRQSGAGRTPPTIPHRRTRRSIPSGSFWS